MPIVSLRLSHGLALRWYVHVRCSLVYMVRGPREGGARLGLGGQFGLLLLLREVWGRLQLLRGRSRRAGHTVRAFVGAALSRRRGAAIDCVLRFMFRLRWDACRRGCRWGGRIDRGCIPPYGYGINGWSRRPHRQWSRVGRRQCDGIGICPLRYKRVLLSTLHRLFDVRLGLRPWRTRRRRDRRKKLSVGDVLGRHRAVKAV